MNRDQRLIAAFAAVATAAAALVGIGIVTDVTPAVAVVSRDVATGPDGVVSVQFVGDTMVGGALQPLVEQRGYDWAFDRVRAPTVAQDFVMATAAAPITPLPALTAAGPPMYSTRPPVAAALEHAGVDALALAGKPVFASGPQGLADTVAQAEGAGLATVGAGRDLARAEQPLLLRTAFGTIGVVALGEGTGDRARELVPGMIELSPESILRGRDLARAAGADWVVAMVHWGTNWVTVQPDQRNWSKQFAAAGYDLVVGSGPHIVQPIELIGAMPVVYSLGNFVYGTKGRFGDVADRGYGLTVGLEIRPGRAPSVTVRCVVADNRRSGFQPGYCNAGQSAAYLPALGELRVQGDRGVLPTGLPPRREVS